MFLNIVLSFFHKTFFTSLFCFSLFYILFPLFIYLFFFLMFLQIFLYFLEFLSFFYHSLHQIYFLFLSLSLCLRLLLIFNFFFTPSFPFICVFILFFFLFAYFSFTAHCLFLSLHHFPLHFLLVSAFGHIFHFPCLTFVFLYLHKGSLFLLSFIFISYILWT